MLKIPASKFATTQSLPVQPIQEPSGISIQPAPRSTPIPDQSTPSIKEQRNSMSFFQMGKFVLSNHINSYRISWQQHNLDVNVENIIQQYIDTHLSNIAHIIRLWNDDPTKLLDDPIGMQVLTLLPEQDTIPGFSMEEAELEIWHKQQLLKGYNNAYNTHFTWDMIK